MSKVVEFALKRDRSGFGGSPDAQSVFHSRRESKRAFIWRTIKAEASDFWFWSILALNFSTVACLLQTWHHAYRLSLNDALCFVFASCCALHWVSLVRYLQVNARFAILGLTLQRGLPRVAQFLAGVLPIFVGFVLFGTIMFGAKVPRFQTASATATTLFSVANGDEIHDTFNAVAYTPWVGQLYVYSYLILFSYVVLMVCIGIIEDAFFSAVFPASWPSAGVPRTSSSSSPKAGANAPRP
jgi:mucolipin 3